jgi:nitroreductase
MKSLEIMKKRQSIRQFSKELISKEHLNLILEAAYNAPIGRAAYDQYKLYVLNEKDKLNKLSTTLIEKAQLTKHPFFEGTLVIFIAGMKTEERLNGCDTGCIIENMMLVASELNIGSCFLYRISQTINNNKELKSFFNLEENYQIMSAVTFGHPLEKNLPLKIRPGIKTKYL